MQLNFISPSSTRTEKLAGVLGSELRALTKKRNHAFVIALSGELGAGKTAFVRGLARGLGIKGPIQSPTFIIMRRHVLKRAGRFKDFWHIDCYRIKKTKELATLNFTKILNNSENIIAVEWAERVKRFLPKDTLWILFAHDSPTVRAITFHHAGR